MKKKQKKKTSHKQPPLFKILESALIAATCVITRATKQMQGSDSGVGITAETWREIWRSALRICLSSSARLQESLSATQGDRRHLQPQHEGPDTERHAALERFWCRVWCEAAALRFPLRFRLKNWTGEDWVDTESPFFLFFTHLMIFWQRARRWIYICCLFNGSEVININLFDQ